MYAYAECVCVFGRTMLFILFTNHSSIDFQNIPILLFLIKQKLQQLDDDIHSGDKRDTREGTELWGKRGPKQRNVHFRYIHRFETLTFVISIMYAVWSDQVMHNHPHWAFKQTRQWKWDTTHSIQNRVRLNETIFKEQRHKQQQQLLRFIWSYHSIVIE